MTARPCETQEIREVMTFLRGDPLRHHVGLYIGQHSVAVIHPRSPITKWELVCTGFQLERFGVKYRTFSQAHLLRQLYISAASFSDDCNIETEHAHGGKLPWKKMNLELTGTDQEFFKGGGGRVVENAGP